MIGDGEFQRYTNVALFYRLVQGGQISYFYYETQKAIREAEQDTGRLRKWLYWQMRPWEFTSDEAHDQIRTPGESYIWKESGLACCYGSSWSSDEPSASLESMEEQIQRGLGCQRLENVYHSVQTANLSCGRSSALLLLAVGGCARHPDRASYAL